MGTEVRTSRVVKVNPTGSKEYPLNTAKLSGPDRPIPMPKEPLPPYFADTSRQNPYRTRPARRAV